MSSEVANVAVVGGGLIGAAAAKYAARSGPGVLLIAAPEPKSEDYGSADVFGGWFDEGRITRRLDMSPVWGSLADSSMNRYADIEKESGITFHWANGYLAVGPRECAFVRETLATARERNVSVTLLDGLEAIRNKGLIGREAIPGFEPVSDMPHIQGIWEREGAGTINPRRLVAAQTRLAVSAGARLCQDIVVRITRDGDGLFCIR